MPSALTCCGRITGWIMIWPPCRRRRERGGFYGLGNETKKYKARAGGAALVVTSRSCEWTGKREYKNVLILRPIVSLLSEAEEREENGEGGLPDFCCIFTFPVVFFLFWGAMQDRFVSDLPTRKCNPIAEIHHSQLPPEVKLCLTGAKRGRFIYTRSTTQATHVF